MEASCDDTNLFRLLQFPGSESQKTNDDNIVYILTTKKLGTVDVKQIHVCLFLGFI